MLSFSRRWTANPVAWLGEHGGLTLLACLAAVVAALAFVGIAELIDHGASQRFDAWVLRSLRRPSDPAKLIGPGFVGEVARDLTALGGVTVLSLTTLAVAGYLALDRRFSSLVIFVAATGGGLLLSGLLKELFHRDRPHVVPWGSFVMTSSFPSSHSMLSAVVYLTVGALLARFARRRILKFYFIALALTLSFLVGLSRLALGVHWPTDVLGGWAIGLAWALLWWSAARWLQGRGLVEPATPIIPPGHDGPRSASWPAGSGPRRE